MAHEIEITVTVDMTEARTNEHFLENIWPQMVPETAHFFASPNLRYACSVGFALPCNRMAAACVLGD